MTQIAIILLSLLATMGLNSVAQEGPHPKETDAKPSDDWLSDKNLDALGDQAPAFLIQKLRNREQDGKKFKVVAKLKTLRGWGRDKEICDGLMSFVEDELAREGEVSRNTVFSIIRALEVIGHRGGSAEIKYLQELASGNFASRKIRIHYGKTAPEYTQFLVQQWAVKGLGQSGDKSARAFLEKIREKPPTTLYPKDFMAVVEQAIQDNAAIAEMGIEKYHSHEEIRKRRKAYQDRKRKKDKKSE